ncbi:hypothetical protein RJT34_06053 [Clitoria ternatea]|uniref:BZIP domain-containing protein n=1 Tax=Clitoria ternatea TaxID=43366 RepID=A0AAN9PRK4_CLITE
MEEVWKDINLASLNDQTTRQTTNLGGVILQDFLARPFCIDPPNPILSSSQTHPSLFCSAPSPAPQPPPPPPPPLATALSLHFDPLTPKPSQPHHPALSKLDSFTNHSSLEASFKRFPDPNHDTTRGDRRNKRMIKNRESAARSRAYTNELELKVEHLKEENARLRRQQQQLYEAAASQPKKKGVLYRTSTAPF